MTIRAPGQSAFAGVLVGATLFSVGCTRSTERNAWYAPPAGGSSLLFTDGAKPQSIPRVVGSTQADALSDEWQVERTYTGTVSSDGAQGRQRVRATREVGGYIETFTGTTGPTGSTYRRTFRDTGQRRLY